MDGEGENMHVKSGAQHTQTELGQERRHTLRREYNGTDAHLCGGRVNTTASAVILARRLGLRTARKQRMPVGERDFGRVQSNRQLGVDMVAQRGVGVDSGDSRRGGGATNRRRSAHGRAKTRLDLRRAAARTA